MKIKLNKESAVAAMIAAIKNASDYFPCPSVYVDCNGNCYTEETRPNEDDCLTAECWRYLQFYRWDEKLGEDVELSREQLLALPVEELQEILAEESKGFELDKALDAILEREDEMYDNALLEHGHLPDELLHKIKREFDFLRRIAGDWDICREQEETFPFFYNHDDVESLMNDSTLETHTLESIFGVFNDVEKNLLTCSRNISESIYKATVHNLLVEWENKEINNTMMHFFTIEDETIYLFTIYC